MQTLRWSCPDRWCDAYCAAMPAETATQWGTSASDCQLKCLCNPQIAASIQQEHVLLCYMLQTDHMQCDTLSELMRRLVNASSFSSPTPVILPLVPKRDLHRTPDQSYGLKSWVHSPHGLAPIVSGSTARYAAFMQPESCQRMQHIRDHSKQFNCILLYQSLSLDSVYSL